MKILICGSRGFDNYEALKEYADDYIRITHDFYPDEPVEIVSGGARGADALAIRYAEEKGFKLTVFMADWKKYGVHAGLKRNKQMADYLKDGNDLNKVIAFWDGLSTGTKNMIQQADKLNLHWHVSYYMNWRK